MPKQIKVSDSTHRKLHLIKDANKTGSLDGAIIHMMQGAVNEMNIIQREQTVITLEYEGYGNVDESNQNFEVFETLTKEITFKTLRKAEVGDIYESPLGNHIWNSSEIATVVYADEDLVVLKIKTITELPWIFKDREIIRLVGVTLF